MGDDDVKWDTSVVVRGKTLFFARYAYSGAYKRGWSRMRRYVGSRAWGRERSGTRHVSDDNDA